jgi:hypothetical protein
MKVKWRVHSVSNQPMMAEVDFNGQKVMADVHGVEVELGGIEGSMHGSTKLRFSGPDADMARKIFVADAIVEADFPEPAQEAPAEAKAA